MGKKQSSLKLIGIGIMSLLILSFVTFGTIAFFRQTDSASKIIGIGQNINFTLTDASKFNISTSANPTGTVSVGSEIANTSGVTGKIRAYVSVSVLDSSGNLCSSVNDLDQCYYTINMSSISGATWVDDPDASATAKNSGACWKYLMTSSNHTVYKEIANNSTIGICNSITIDHSLPTGYTLKVVTSVEMLQFNNVDWSFTNTFTA